MMKRFGIILGTFLFFSNAFGQILRPVQWSYAAKKINSTEAVLFIKATIGDGWHIYAQDIADGGPVKTSFSFVPSAAYQLIGKTTEPHPASRFEKVFNMQVNYFEHAVIFQQRIRIKTTQATIKGQLEYMVCNDQKCLPPDQVTFSIPFK